MNKRPPFPYKTWFDFLRFVNKQNLSNEYTISYYQESCYVTDKKQNPFSDSICITMSIGSIKANCLDELLMAFPATRTGTYELHGSENELLRIINELINNR